MYIYLLDLQKETYILYVLNVFYGVHLSFVETRGISFNLNVTKNCFQKCNVPAFDFINIHGWAFVLRVFNTR